MSKQAKELEVLFSCWDIVVDLLKRTEPTAETQELLDALLAMAED